MTTDQSSPELMMPARACEPLCVNQAARTTLLAIMPTLDDVDIAPVQMGDQSHGVVIPRLGGSMGSRSRAPAGGRGGGSTGGSSVARAPGKGK
jgi:hypothetical protein